MFSVIEVPPFRPSDTFQGYPRPAAHFGDAHIIGYPLWRGEEGEKVTFLWGFTYGDLIDNLPNREGDGGDLFTRALPCGDYILL